jgi:hypothetical protein
MRRFASICFALAVIGCADVQDEPEVVSDSLPVAPAGLAVSDLTGTWTVRVMPEDRDTVVLTYQLNAPADTSQWTMKFPERAEPIPTHIVSLAGDSVVLHSGSYRSALRRGVMVTSTRAVARLQNGVMVGTVVARYATSGADSVARLRTEATRGQ